MSQKVIVAPSILAANFGRLAEEISDVSQHGADWLHIDVMDGSFVPPITFGGNVVALAKKTCDIFLDVHLMIAHPELHIDTFVRAGADQITIHTEVCPHAYRVLADIQARGLKSGIALNPATPAEAVFPILPVCDLVLVMTVNPGWGGQAFIPNMLSKIERLRTEITRLQQLTVIEVDGGINPETGRACVQAGARALVAGSYIFDQADRAKAIASLRV